MQATFRFYAELNDHLPRERRGVAFTHRFEGAPAIKDVIEALGVPHPEVDLILLDGRSVGFDVPLRDGAYVSVYPVFEALDIAPVCRVRPEPLREPRFVADAHLLRLAWLLRFAGFDTWFSSDADDAEIVALAVRERRTVLTRDRRLLTRRDVTHGHWIRSQQPAEQLAEVVRRFSLGRLMRPFTRCGICNAVLRDATRAEVSGRLPPRVAGRQERLRLCPECRRVYWEGTHHARIASLLEAAAGRSSDGEADGRSDP